MKKVTALPLMEDLEPDCIYITGEGLTCDLFVTTVSGMPLAVRGSIFPPGYFSGGSADEPLEIRLHRLLGALL